MSNRTYTFNGVPVSAGSNLLLKRPTDEDPNISLLKVAGVVGELTTSVRGRDLTVTQEPSDEPNVVFLYLQLSYDFGPSVLLRIRVGGEEDQFIVMLQM